MAAVTDSAPTAASLRAAFAEPSAPTVGLEEELMLLHPETHDLLPRVPELLDRAGGDRRFKAELPAAQVEIAAPPARTVGEGAAALRAARHDLAALADGLGVLGAAGLHPFTDGIGATTPGGRYDELVAEFGDVIRRQLCCGLHVHVAVRPAERAIAVHDALRSYLPHIAALAANAPFYEGRDTGLASFRPQIAELLPRQGIPPVLGSVEHWAEALAWGTRAGAIVDGTRWWWELRPHPVYGTLEVRVADAQTTVADAAAIGAVVQCLVAWLAGQERLEVHERWRIEANRWSAGRHGTAGTFADLATGEQRPTAEVLLELLEQLAPVAEALGCADELSGARRLVGSPPWSRVREAGPVGAATMLAARFLD
jgi:glutamate---cysteine ligase / carboxylate-amine ligase